MSFAPKALATIFTFSDCQTHSPPHTFGLTKCTDSKGKLVSTLEVDTYFSSLGLSPQLNTCTYP